MEQENTVRASFGSHSGCGLWAYISREQLLRERLADLESEITLWKHCHRDVVEERERAETRLHELKVRPSALYWALCLKRLHLIARRADL